MDRLAAMQAFVRVVESGSFVRAAERLGASTTTTSRQVAELESHLGARLLNRTTRKLSLTESGQAFFERCVQLLHDLDEAEALAAQTTVSPRGTIRLTCSHDTALKRIAPGLAQFVARYPDLRLDVTVADRLVDLVEEGFDVAVRIGRIGSDQLIARKLGTMQQWPCAAPAYLKRRGTPQTIADLQQHDLLSYAYTPVPRQWVLFDRDGARHEVRANGALHANSGDMLVAAAIGGLGIVCEPDFLVAQALAARQLVRVLPGVVGMPGDIWAVYPSRRHLSAKVRLFIEHIAQAFAADAPGSATPPAAPRRASNTRRPSGRGRE